jgi:DNA polymerase III epsilon subunit-like protein
MKLLKEYVREVLLESSKMIGMSLEDILIYLRSLEGRNIIFFDTETTGLKPGKAQVTEIAALVVPLVSWNDEFTISAKFHEKAKLTDETQARIKRQSENPYNNPKFKSVSDLLAMTSYEEHDKEFLDEHKMLLEFKEFSESIPNRIYAAHNASFDMRIVNGRLRKYNEEPIPTGEVLDTLSVVRLFLQPVIRSATAGERTADMASKLDTGRGGMWKYSSSLGDLAKASGMTIDNWHSADADVLMMMKVIQSAIDEIENGKFDIEKADREAKKSQASYFRRREKKGRYKR